MAHQHRGSAPEAVEVCHWASPGTPAAPLSTRRPPYAARSRRAPATLPPVSHRWDLRCPPPDLHLPVPVATRERPGLSPREARRVTWRRCAPGHYVPAAADRGRVEQRIAEEAARLPPGGAVTGWAALRMAGGGFFDGLGPQGQQLPVPLVVPAGASLRPAPTILRHREQLPPGDVVLLQGVPCVRPARALFAAMACLPELRARVVAGDMALSARLTDLPELRGHLAGCPGRRGRARVLEACPLVSARSRSPQESLLRLIWLLDAHLPPPLCNWPVLDEHRVPLGRPDLLCPALAVAGEYDGAEHRSLARQTDDAARDQAFRGVGLETFRVTAVDLARPARVRDRMLRAVELARAARRERGWLLPQHPGPL